MIVNKEDALYFSVVDYIIKDKTFRKTANFQHHGTTRLRHSMRVSYLSYKIAKKLGLNQKVAAISGLLHDFYLQDESKGFSNFMKFQKLHPKIAAANAIKHFKVSDKEKEIIETHMWPFTKPSKSLEGWIVSLTDKTVGAYEYSIKFRKALSYRLKKKQSQI
ncbi:MAG: HDIG domain-containing protein [Bacilli bacterium]|nr:HDIG domain-containing protein [Bacilli bacterium]MDD4411499.1 HDIG domain-containing protein [Bacilli bacterium]